MANDKKFVVKNGLHSTGDITVTGTVDGRDVAADGITLDGLATTSNAYADQAELDAIASAEAKDVVRATAANTYADDAITALVDGAPSTLDTLNELAAALGDDPNFADTINTSLATKSTIVLSDTAPVSPTPISGDLWFDTTDGSLNVYYNDGSSSQWVGTSGATGTTGNGGGGVTSYADITARNASAPIAGAMAFVISETALYVYDGNEWDRVYSGVQSALDWTIEPSGVYSLLTDGSTTIVSSEAVDVDGFPVTYEYDTNPVTPIQVTSIVNNNDGSFTMTPSTNIGDAGQFTLRVKANDGLNVTSKTSQIQLSFVPQTAANIGYFNFADSFSYSGSGNAITNRAFGTPASVTETIVPGSGGYLSTGTVGLPVFRFMPADRTSINFSASMGTIAKTVMVIFSATSAQFNQQILWGTRNWDYLGILTPAGGIIVAGFPDWAGETEEVRVNGTVCSDRGVAYNALDLTGTKFNSVTCSGYIFNTFMAYNSFPGDYADEHEVLGFLMWDTVLTTSELEVAHTLLAGNSLTAPWAP
jgi:hypothetical protein